MVSLKDLRANSSRMVREMEHVAQTCRPPIVDHRAHRIVDGHQLIDAGAAAITSAAFGARSVNDGSSGIVRHVQQTPFVFAGRCRHTGVGIQHAHQALRNDADQA